MTPQEQEKICGMCAHWRSFAGYYEDPLEPDHIGHCLNRDSKFDACSDDKVACSLWEINGDLE